MKLHRKLEAQSAPLALAIGNFDGVHRGHQAILDAACNATLRASSRLGLQPAAMTFAPLPREYFAKLRGDPTLAPARLMSVTEKLAAFAHSQMQHVFIPHFNFAFASLSPHEFMSALSAMNVKWLMVGEDFRFGAKRAGDVAMLREYGIAHGFTVETMADIADANGERISSTAVRHALGNGDLITATRMLGRPYSIVGRVTHGKKLGRTLGFPTANVALTGRKPAIAGVFAVKFNLVTRGLEGVVRTSAEKSVNAASSFLGVANLGTNPVVSIENRHHLEVFLFDYSNDLYSKRVQVEFIEKIRDEQNFAGPDALTALVAQMHDDCAQAKRILKIGT
jgi:riboflavin kinase / FMN adenylyltransferase